MQTINLSKLIFSPLFLGILKESGLQFDHIFTDNENLAKEEGIERINENLPNFFSKKQGEKVLFLLDQMGSNDILPAIKGKFETCYIINARTGIGSFGKKLAPENTYLNTETCQNFSPVFPFDLEGLIKALKHEKNKLILLSNQEVPGNKYENNNDEELQIIDKAIVDEPELLHLLTPEHPELLLIGTGNHFEELVKLSQLLQQEPEKTALMLIGKRELLSSEAVQHLSKSSKKIWIILDHLPNEELKKLLEKILGKPVHLLTPAYKKLSSFFPEYQFEQTNFDAQNLFNQSLQLLK